MSCETAFRDAAQVMLPLVKAAEQLSPGERRALQEVVRLLALLQVALGALLALVLIGGAAVILAERPDKVGPVKALFAFSLICLGSYFIFNLLPYVRIASGG